MAFLVTSWHTVSVWFLGHLLLPLAFCLFQSALSQELPVHLRSPSAAFAWQCLYSSLGARGVCLAAQTQRVQGRNIFFTKTWSQFIYAYIHVCFQHPQQNVPQLESRPSTLVCWADIPTETYPNHIGSLATGQKYGQKCPQSLTSYFTNNPSCLLHCTCDFLNQTAEFVIINPFVLTILNLLP